ncbi:NAD(P)H-binding protein [Litoreibacter roseus]|uniref:NAD(P)-dependent oxidoreductase n=1 Tax=Litoreibacter roseus TaxID=2601869 RepID=A0A6N6JC00_9RHOB|nr:NAD(P)H-binding protein [Litoreibacter roseus]GFE63831.1 NAD(P)-dependent oxidoreductase [Litoreibacter roseus]
MNSSKSTPKVMITGATGQLGGLAISALLKRMAPIQIAALVRQKKEADARVSKLDQLGIETREADYEDPASLRQAMSGIERLLFVSSNSFEPRRTKHQKVIDVAQASGVKFIAYTSILIAQETPLVLATDHRETEDMLTASSIDHVVLRSGWYLENHLNGAQQAVKDGFIAGAAADGRFSSAGCADYAAAAAVVVHPDFVSTRQFLELAGDVPYSLYDFAAALSEQFDTDIRYRFVCCRWGAGGRERHTAGSYWPSDTFPGRCTISQLLTLRAL